MSQSVPLLQSTSNPPTNRHIRQINGNVLPFLLLLAFLFISEENGTI